MNKTLSLTELQQHINTVLENRLPPADQAPQRLHQAMRYVVLNGGKRLRSLLVYAAGACFTFNEERLDPPAAAVEFIHSYSLVHDDLPAMDNDDLRRGQPTCHKAFDEATAILVGDALQCLAFDCLSEQAATHPLISTTMIRTLSKASGSQGMVGGQALDLEAEAQPVDLPTLEKIHHLKTGALIEASVLLGAIAGQYKDDTHFLALKKFANHLGLAFQIQDDILDVEGEEQLMGKKTGADAATQKATYPALLGLDGAKKHRQHHYESAMEILTKLPLNTNDLETICQLTVDRKS